MTDVSEAPAVAAEGAGEKRRGRPRPDTTVQRDEQVLAQITEPRTRGQLAELTGLETKAVYLSLHRLQRDGRITRTRSGADHVWTRAEAPPAS
jgi:hypothetical protein